MALSFRWTLPLLLGLGCATSQAGDAPPPGGDQPAPLRVDDSLPGSYGALSNVVATRAGKVFWADTRARRLYVGDFGSHTVTPLGVPRTDTLTAAAPADAYRFPGALAVLGDDSVAVVDFAALRVTTWSGAGRALGVVPVPIVMGATPVLNYDRRGYGYKLDYQSVLGGGEPGTAVRTDSVGVLRLGIGRVQVDTVARIAAPDYGDAMFGEQMQQVPVIFGPTDLFGVLPDGSLWVARARQNRVDWRAPDGRWQRGTPRAWTPVPVTDADTGRVLARLRQQGLPTGVPVQFPFAKAKPPFEAGLASSRGEVWLLRARASEEAPAVYDVWGRDGRWRRAVACPTGVALAGFGEDGTIYGSRRAADGSRQLVRLRG